MAEQPGTPGETDPYDLGDPAFTRQPVWSLRNGAQLLLAILVVLPSVFATSVAYDGGAATCEAGWLTTPCWRWIAVEEPIAAINLLFFLNVCVGFWVVSLVQRSCWLIDLYWTLVPPLAFVFFGAHPAAQGDPLRLQLVRGLLLIWSFRLTYNYLRRERMRFGAREDWRFAKQRREMKGFWWYAFFYAFLSQQVLLMGLVLPLWAIHHASMPIGPFDGILGLSMGLGILIAHLGDTQLHAFMQANAERARRGEAKKLVLDTGIWRYSRHPNYFGEQLFWWSLAGFGLVTGHPWVALGTAINSVVMFVVTSMTEKRMVARGERAAAYHAYRGRTSMWVPWFVRDDA